MTSTFARLGATAAASLAVFAFATPAAQAAPTGGANQDCGAYCPSGVGEPSGNGKSDNENSNKPDAGTVGKADSKNPPGQAPDGSDSNNGYECDGNEGVGKTNPAHSGCGTYTPPPPPEECPEGLYYDPVTESCRS